MKSLRLSFCIIWLSVAAFGLAACGGGPVAPSLTTPVATAAVQQPAEPPADTQPPQETLPPAETAPATEPPAASQTSEIASPAPDYQALPLPLQRGALSSGSGACAVCHTNMQDESGADVSVDRMWRSTTMANSARDPYWQASVRSEALQSPQYKAVIEDKCATCHMPLARLEAQAVDGQGTVLDDGFLDSSHELHTLALDGISCNLCHQVRADGFGEPQSFSGGYVVDMQLPMGERESFGPYEIGKQQAALMQAASGFIPLQGVHIEQSEMCGTCHNLYTPYLDAQDQIAGEFPEQTIHLEWYNSQYAQDEQGRSCQSCHMPQAQGSVQLSITGGPPRSPFFQHQFVGGNVYMLNMLSAFGGELATTAAPEHFEASIANAAAQIEQRTAVVSLQDIRLEDGLLLGQVRVENLAGHKFPAGFPARRAWLRLALMDADGQILFESGAYARDGSIVGNDNDQDPASYEPHYLQIDSPDQVQIYEAIMQTTEGQVTTTLLRGASYAKDNRLLPVGFDKASVVVDIAPQGEAAQDEDFLDGGDTLAFAIELGEAQGPFSLSVELLYQTIGYRWADNLRSYDAPEIGRFIGYYDVLPNLPLVAGADRIEVKP